jgi:hypothetical protein
MSISMKLALNKEACFKKWMQPWWPLDIFFMIINIIIRTTTSL